VTGDEIKKGSKKMDIKLCELKHEFSLTFDIEKVIKMLFLIKLSFPFRMTLARK